MAKETGVSGPLPSLATIDLKALEDDISRGAFPHVAAGAHGLSSPTHWRYMQRGKAGLEKINDNQQIDANTQMCVDYFKAVTRAHLRARALAEGRVFVDKPEMWLRYGPGRDRGPENPGWTETVRIEKRTNVEISLSEDTAALLGEIVQTFNEGPEARVIDAPEARNGEFSRGSTAKTALSVPVDAPRDAGWAEIDATGDENE